MTNICAWEVHEAISESMERTLSKCFRCKTRLGRLSNKLQEATFEDLDHISFESTDLFKDLHAKFETNKLGDKIKCYFYTTSNFSTVK